MEKISQFHVGDGMEEERAFSRVGIGSIPLFHYSMFTEHNWNGVEMAQVSRDFYSLFHLYST
jgi:hypothetical protein